MNALLRSVVCCWVVFVLATPAWSQEFRATVTALGGVLLHDEPRPLLADAMAALRLPLVHARSAVIANVDGTASPFYDAVWMHRASE
jgi:hypothetical protein